MKWSIGRIRAVSRDIAVRFVTVDSYPEKVEMYQSYGFIVNKHDKYQKKDDHVSMRFDLINIDIKE